jgi:hypothetical protein
MISESIALRGSRASSCEKVSVAVLAIAASPFNKALQVFWKSRAELGIDVRSSLKVKGIGPPSVWRPCKMSSNHRDHTTALLTTNISELEYSQLKARHAPQ